ncbi:MAG TPA: preprotein translocase subunit YajC [Sandaracinaceae bacterium LLY-WYZ-13_1]|nr:preprotein translocase subunit YajC [Sandaracinaceae bacterium LLY-WYZ-13_1]
MQAGLFAVMMIVFYFFLLRPEQKRRKEHEELLKSLRKGTKVRTTGGILGEVVTVNEDEVVLQVADKVRVNVLRAHISTVESARKAQAEGDDDKKSSSKKKEKKDDSDDDAKESRDEA